MDALETVSKKPSSTMTLKLEKLPKILNLKIRLEMINFDEKALLSCSTDISDRMKSLRFCFSNKQLFRILCLGVVFRKPIRNFWH